VVSPSQKKSAVAHVIDQQRCSMRRACHYLGLPRSTYRYTPKPLTDRQQQLHQRIETLSFLRHEFQISFPDFEFAAWQIHGMATAASVDC